MTTRHAAMSVIKLGGSVLTGPDGYRAAAAFVRARLRETPGDKLLVIVSAAHGETDNLEEMARSIVPAPDPATLDLLWATGEMRSVAELVLRLQAVGVGAVGLNVHETGLVRLEGSGGPVLELRPLGLRHALSHAAVVVVPGFLARGAGDRIVSLGRGGSDLTAVFLAQALGASRCELVKDVAGYFTCDPHEADHARHVPALTFDEALAKAEAGCALVQRAAIETAARSRLPIVVRALDPKAPLSRISAPDLQT